MSRVHGMATKTIYFTVNGRAEQAEFPVDCPPLDVKGKDWCLGSEPCFKHKPRLGDCSQEITEVWAVLTEEHFKVVFVGEEEAEVKHPKCGGGGLSWRQGCSCCWQPVTPHRRPRLRLKKTTYIFKTISWDFIKQTTQLFFRITVCMIEDIKIVLTCSLFFSKLC